MCSDFINQKINAILTYKWILLILKIFFNRVMLIEDR